MDLEQNKPKQGLEQKQNKIDGTWKKIQNKIATTWTWNKSDGTKQNNNVLDLEQK